MVNLVSAKYRRGEYANQTLTLPVVGKVTFNKDGSLDVEEQHADDIIEHTKESLMLRRKDPVKGQENDPYFINQKRIDSLTEQLSVLKLPQLVELAKEAKIEINPQATDEKIRKDLLKELMKQEETDESE